ncbi:MAG TPA: hypothetical protein VH596_09660 [Terriglobales bacterium]|jgi:hypothetical protein
MKGAFVVRLGPGTKPSEDHFEGWAEEVDSGKEVKFHSLDELVRFLTERFQMGLTTERREENSLNEIQSREEDS